MANVGLISACCFTLSGKLNCDLCSDQSLIPLWMNCCVSQPGDSLCDLLHVYWPGVFVNTDFSDLQIVTKGWPVEKQACGLT